MSDCPAVVRPVQERLTLLATSRGVALVAIVADLGDVAAHRFPALDLTTVLARQPAARVTGDRDPGYGSTAKMISEAAICLANDVDRKAVPGGLWTPASAMGTRLIDRLQRNAGLTFEMLGD